MARSTRTATEEVTETVEAEGNGQAKRTRRMPTYVDVSTVEGLDELPDEAPSGRKLQYFNMLSQLAQREPGKFYPVTQFQTPTGARNAVKALAGYTNRKGEFVAPTTTIPEGEWEFRDRKIAVGAGKHSILYAKLNG